MTMHLDTVGDYVVFRDNDGRRHAVIPRSIMGLHEHDNGTSIAMTGGRVVNVDEDFDSVVQAFTGQAL